MSIIAHYLIPDVSNPGHKMGVPDVTIIDTYIQPTLTHTCLNSICVFPQTESQLGVSLRTYGAVLWSQ